MIKDGQRGLDCTRRKVSAEWRLFLSAMHTVGRFSSFLFPTYSIYQPFDCWPICLARWNEPLHECVTARIALCLPPRLVRRRSGRGRRRLGLLVPGCTDERALATGVRGDDRDAIFDFGPIADWYSMCPFSPSR